MGPSGPASGRRTRACTTWSDPALLGGLGRGFRRRADSVEWREFPPPLRGPRRSSPGAGSEEVSTLSTSGDRHPGIGHLGIGASPIRPPGLEGVGRPPTRTRARRATVYDGVRQLLTLRGWIQGREEDGERLSLTAAIDAAVEADPSRGPVGRQLARRGRVRRHLRELVGTASLIAWNDQRERRVDEVLALLDAAAVAHPDD